MRKIAIVTLLVVGASAYAAESTAPLVAKMQRYYDATKDLHAKFEQQLASQMTARPKKAEGEVWLKKPGKMRWDYAKPEKKLMVSDGATLWVYEPEDEQAFKQDMHASTLPAQVSFLLGEAKLEKEFDITAAAGDDVKLAAPGAGETVLKLVPKQGTTAYRYLLFSVDEKTGQVRKTVVLDQQGGTNTLAFTDVKQNSGVSDSKFNFSPPNGTKILHP